MKFIKKIILTLTVVTFAVLVSSCTADAIEETTQPQTKNISQKQDIKANRVMTGDVSNPR